jgi:hypothetical protein
MEQLSLGRGSVRGTWGGGWYFLGTLRDRKRAVEMERLSRCRSSLGEPGGKLLFWGL